MTQDQLEIQHLRFEVARLQGALTSAKLLTALLQPPPPPVVPLDLTRRDCEVLTRLFEGDSNRQIAARLFMAPGTVKSHLARIAEQFGTHSRHAAVVAATRAGFVPDKPVDD